MEMIIFDTETTGLLLPENAPLHAQPKIIEFYGVKLDENFAILEEFNTMIDPKEPISKEITRITGINDNMVKGMGGFDSHAEDLHKFFEDCDLSIAHNHAFDAGMLKVEYARLDQLSPIAKNAICTVEATMGLTGHRLSLTRLHWMLLQQQFKAHRAKDDVFALVRCFHNLTESGVIDLNEYNPDRV